METELTMDCFGSVILFRKESGYCDMCPLANTCEKQVEENKLAIQEMLNRPVFNPDGRFWSEGVKATHKKVKAAQRGAPPPKPVASVAPVAPPPTAPEPAIGDVYFDGDKARFYKWDGDTWVAIEPGAGMAQPRYAATGVLSPYEASVSTDIPTKVSQALTSWHNKGVSPAELLIGKNPFQGKGLKTPFTLTEARRTFSRQPSRKELYEAFAAAMSRSDGQAWAETSLKSNFNIVAGAYKACGVFLYD